MPPSESFWARRRAKHEADPAAPEQPAEAPAPDSEALTETAMPIVSPDVPAPPPPTVVAEETSPADERSIREAAEREALARLADAERRSAAEPTVDEPSSSEPESSAAVAGADRESVEQAVEPREALLSELQNAEDELEAQRVQEERLARELAATEERLTRTQRQTAEALERAISRLEEVEARAAEAEARADRAERLAALKAEERERTARLREILDRIAAAEERASAAEQRARAAVEQVSEPLAPIDPDEVASDQPAPADAPTGQVSINAATYEELRALGLSVTQAGRVLARRERSGPFSSVDELDLIPGFEADFLGELKTRLIT